MNVAIVVAAGKGTRLGGVRPKQFLELGGVPIIIHTLRQFERSQQIDEIIVVLPPEEIVAVHDGVRPLVTPAEIDATMHAARANGAAILTAAVGDTIKEIEGHQVIRT